MSAALRLVLIAAVFAAGASAQIGNLSATADGRGVYFSTTDESLRQRGSTQPFSRKVFLLRDEVLTLIEDSQGLRTPVPSAYARPAVSAGGGVLAVNRQLICLARGQCTGLQMSSTLIQTPTQKFTFPGNADLTANGRFAAIYDGRSVQVLDLSTGQLTLVGQQPGDSGQFVSEDGTVLIFVPGPGGQGLQLIGPSKSAPLHSFNPWGFFGRVLLAGDASRIIYDVELAEIHTLDVKTDTDRSLGPGWLPMLAQDGRHFSYLRREKPPWRVRRAGATVPWFSDTQVWLGDAVTGDTRRLSNEPEGISDQTITGNGSAVIAATRTGRLLSIDTSNGAVTQLLGSPGPAVLFVSPVRGSYNEVVGSFPNGAPEVLIGGMPAIVLGASPRGFAIQIPWEVPPPLYPQILLRGSESAWERLLQDSVQDLFPVILPLGPPEPGPPWSSLSSYTGFTGYAIHENWSGLVNHGSPARPGEIIHLYGSGWGPVDGTVPTGKPTPSDRPYRITAPCDWRATGALKNPESVSTNFEVFFAGLAPGLVGVYQFDFRIPTDWKDSVFDAFCKWSSGSSTFYAGTAAIEVQP